MEFAADNWGSLASVIGVVVSLIGLGWAIIEARRARSASQAARQAANETRGDIARHLQAVDLERAIALIQRIKLLHDTERWEAALEQYQSLRGMLSDIIVRCPESQTAILARLDAARSVVSQMENRVRNRAVRAINEPVKSRLDRQLNQIQSDLEELSSELGFGDPQEETR